MKDEDLQVIPADDSEASEAAPTDVIGMVDLVSEDGILGWAWSPAEPKRRISLSVVHGGKVIGTVVADRFRRDLEPNGVGDGCHAFDFRPAPGTEISRDSVAVYVEGTAIPLLRNDGDAPRLLVDDVMRRIVAAEGALRMLTDRVVALHHRGQADAAAIGRLSADTRRQTEDLRTLREQLSQTEVFVMRLDEKLASAETRLKESGAGSAGNKAVRAALLAAVLFGGIAGALAAWALR